MVRLRLTTGYFNAAYDFSLLYLNYFVWYFLALLVYPIPTRWTRRSGSETDSEDDVVGGGCAGSGGGHVSVPGHVAGGLEEARRLHGGSHQRLHHGGNESAPSPQLSLAEFLKDV